MTTDPRPATQDDACCAPTCCAPASDASAAADPTPASPEPMPSDNIHTTIRATYGYAARQGTSCCGPSSCGPTTTDRAQMIGYTPTDLLSVPDGANLGLGCGNPTALAALEPGDVVLDLGSGPGLDALLAAQRVGPTGRVIGVDTTPEMLERARLNATSAGFDEFVEFREGLIEAIPVDDATVDVILSNCVINLATDKAAVFREAFRVLKPGGRLSVSDIVLSADLPPALRDNLDAWSACLGGAMHEEAYLGAMRDAGFTAITHTRTPAAGLFTADAADPVVSAVIREVGDDAVAAAADSVWSYAITASKPT